MKVTLFKMEPGATKGPGLFTRQCHTEHLGLGYIASILMKEGHFTNLLYQDSSPITFAKKIVETNPEVVCATSMTYTHTLTRDVLGMIKSELPNIKTIVGGDHVSGWPKSVDDQAIDYIVRGEGEDTILELINTLENKRDASNIPGIGYYKEGVIMTEPRMKRTDLDKLPFPYRNEEILDRTSFFSVMDPSSSQMIRLGAIITSRGCPFNCKQCGSKNTLGVKTRWRSAKNVVDEMQYLKDKFGTNTLIFYDLTFNLRRDKVLELCNEIITRGLSDIKWYTIARISDNTGKPMLDREMLQAMHSAGCRKIGYGIETFDKGLQNVYNKSNSIEVVEEILHTADEIGILNRGFLMLSPWETEESLNAAKRMLKRLPLHEIRFSCLTPYPGTLFYEECRQKDIILSDDFSRYSSDELILRPTNFTISELYKLRFSIFKEFINSSEYQARVKDKIKRNPNFEQGFKEYFSLLESQEVMN